MICDVCSLREGETQVRLRVGPPTRKMRDVYLCDECVQLPLAQVWDALSARRKRSGAAVPLQVVPDLDAIPRVRTARRGRVEVYPYTDMDQLRAAVTGGITQASEGGER